MKYFISFFGLLLSLFSFCNNSIASLTDEESLSHESQQLLKSPLLDIDVKSVEEFANREQLLKSFHPLLDMGEDIIIKAFDFVSNCKTLQIIPYQHLNHEQEIIEPKTSIFFISPLGSNNIIEEAIQRTENYSQFQYFFVTAQEDVIDTLKSVKDLKETLNLDLDNQIKLIMFSPLGVEKPKTEYNLYNNLIPRQNMISFILQYSYQFSRTCCPLGVSIDIPSDKHDRSRISMPSIPGLQTISCGLLGSSRYYKKLDFTKENLENIYSKVLHRWDFRTDGIANEAFKDEDDVLNKVGKYSSNSVGDKVIAFFGGYTY